MSFRMVFELMVITKKQVQPLDFSYGVHVVSLWKCLDRKMVHGFYCDRKAVLATQA